MADREGVRRIHNLVLAAVVTLAVLALTLYGGASPSLDSAAAATGTSGTGTSGPAPGTSTTTSTTDCTPVAPTSGGVTPGATTLFLTVTSPSAYQCGELRTTVVTVYADADHTSLVTSQVLYAGTTS